MTTRGTAVLSRPSRRMPTDWMERALCKGKPGFTEWPIRDQVTYCKRGCPVMAECGLYGVGGPVWREGDQGTVFGGMRPATIKKLQKMRAMAS